MDKKFFDHIVHAGDYNPEHTRYMERRYEADEARSRKLGVCEHLGLE